METAMMWQEMSKELVRLATLAHRQTNSCTDEVKAMIRPRAITLLLEDSTGEGSGGGAGASSTTGRITDVRSVLWHNIALRMTPTVQQVVEFAKRLPGFHTLPQDDQVILIKLGFFEIWLSRISKLSSPERIVFEDGTIISIQQLAIIYDHAFAIALLTYIWNLQCMQISEEEMAVYTGTLLLCPHRAGLTAIERVSGLQHALNDALQYNMITLGGPMAIAISRARYEAFATVRNEVRLIGTRHAVLLQWPRDHGPRLMFPALFSEVFDIPKVDDVKVAAAAATAAASVDAAQEPAQAQAQGPGASSSLSLHSSDQLSQLG